MQQEKNTGELQQLQHDFYAQIDRYLDSLSKQYGNEECARQAENTRRMQASLMEKRRQKLLLYLAYNKPLPAAMPAEDEQLYNEMRGVLEGNDSRTKISKLKIISDIPEVFTSEGRKIGPFKLGEVVEMTDRNDVEFVIKNKIGEILAQ